MFRISCPYRDVCVIRVYAIGVRCRLWVLMDETEYFEFWSFCVEFMLCRHTFLVLMAMCRPAWVVYFWTSCSRHTGSIVIFCSLLVSL